MIVRVSSAKILSLVCLPFFTGKKPSKTKEKKTLADQSEGGALPPPNGLFFSCARWNAAGVALAGIFFFFFRWVAWAQISLISSWGGR